jgi:hypothetical protein
MSRKDDEVRQPHGGMQVWVFMGEKGQYPMAVWTRLDFAHRYIHDNQLSGSLTAFELNSPVYDWAISTGKFKPKQDQHRSVKFRQTFSNQCQEHYTFREGHCAALGNPKYVSED